MSFTPEELAEIADADLEIERQPFRLLPLERIAAAELDREAKLALMDHRKARNWRTAFLWRQKHSREIAEKRRAYYADNRERERRQNKAWYEAHKSDPDQIERMRANRAAWWLENGETYNAQRREKRAANLEGFRDRERAYREKNRERINSRKREAYQKDAEGRERHNAKSREYYAAHRDEINARKRAARAEQRARAGT